MTQDDASRLQQLREAIEALRLVVLSDAKSSDWKARAVAEIYAYRSEQK